MTVTLELNPDAEAAAKAEARTRGTTLENYLQQFLEQAFPPAPSGEKESKTEDAEAVRRRRQEILSRLQGKYASFPGGSEEFAARKAEEKAREERRWQEKP